MSASKFISRDKEGKYTINSGMPEFGYELIATLPYAYFLHQKGELKKTVSACDTSALYFFSPEHIEVAEKRDWENVVRLQEADFPNIEIHRSQLDWKVFEPPSLQKFYEDKKIVFEKPTLVITNRKNVEWRGDPINYIDDDTLSHLIELLKHSYQLVYIDPADFGALYEDHFEAIQTGFKGDSNVLTFRDLRQLYPGLTVNELQCRLYAGCNKFISSNGGLGILCSYFEGENIIFSKLCRELDEEVNSFYSWYYRLSHASVSVVNTEDALLRLVSDKWVKNKPLFNVLIRAGGKPNCFHDCIRSVYAQDYPNINVYVSVEDAQSLEYVRRHQCAIVNVEAPPLQPDGAVHAENRGEWEPGNLHLNRLLHCTNTGYALYLDEDDMLCDADALSQIADVIERKRADVVFWRTALPNRVMPSDKNWGQREFNCGDTSKMGICHSVKIKPKWEPWNSASSRAAQFLQDSGGHIEWLDQTFSGSQQSDTSDIQPDKDKGNIAISAYTNVAVVLVASDAQLTLKRCLDAILANRCGDDFRVLVGINGCAQTYPIAKQLTRNYDGQVAFYNTGNRNAPVWAVRNALLKKLYRRDCLVYFANIDDILPRKFIAECLDEYNRLVSRTGFQGALRPGVFGVDAALVASAETFASLTDSERTAKIKTGLAHPQNTDVRKLLLSGMLHSERSHVYQKLFGAYWRNATMQGRYDSDTGQFKDMINTSNDSFFCSYEGLAAAGTFTDPPENEVIFFESLKTANIGVEISKNALWVLKKIRDAEPAQGRDMELKSGENILPHRDKVNQAKSEPAVPKGLFVSLHIVM